MSHMPSQTITARGRKGTISCLHVACHSIYLDAVTRDSYNPSMANECPTCEGNGEIGYYRKGSEQVDSKRCPDCHGTGKQTDEETEESNAENQ